MSTPQQSKDKADLGLSPDVVFSENAYEGWHALGGVSRFPEQFGLGFRAGWLAGAAAYEQALGEQEISPSDAPKESVEDRVWTSLVQEVWDWQRKTFPHSTASACVEHLSREVKELAEDPSDRMELADCFLLLLGTAKFSNTDLLAVGREKFEIAKTRTWGPPDAHGVSEHVREGQPATSTEPVSVGAHGLLKMAEDLRREAEFLANAGFPMSHDALCGHADTLQDWSSVAPSTLTEGQVETSTGEPQKGAPATVPVERLKALVAMWSANGYCSPELNELIKEAETGVSP